MSTEKLSYTREWTDEAAFPLLGFTKTWESPTDYPTYETDEAKVRQDMQSLHDETKNYINETLIPAILAEDATEEARAAAEAAREKNEQTRVQNETARIEAESARVEAESARVEEFNSMQENSENATQAANDAAASVENLTVDYTELPPGSPVAVQKGTNEDGGINLHFDLPRGTSGVYVGSGEMPEDANVQVDPTGDPTDTGNLMLLPVYDPQGKKQDVFKYVDDKVSGVSAESLGVPTTESMNTAIENAVNSAIGVAIGGSY